ncbi:hypothetical protein AB0D46_37580 [Streptomyces sp. NPDC048383]|uniref:hypothetical protein n=1 Tax=Streptomyces sp. NPDC048383 TaxID=3155386 RepID=UPI0034163572
MDHTAHINHDAVLRARVSLLASGTLPVRRQVAAYRVLVQVSPLAYLPRLVEALYAYSAQEFWDRPDIALALRTEALSAARRMGALEQGWEELIAAALAGYGEQLALMGRGEEAEGTYAEIRSLGCDPRAVLDALRRPRGVS